MSEEKPQPVPRMAIVKQIVSGDTILLRSVTNKPNPSEKQISFEYVGAPKLARRPGPGASSSDTTKDEPFAWEAREFLRKKLIGEPVWFVCEKLGNSNRIVGSIRYGKEYESAENIIETMVKEGLCSVRMRSAGNNKVVETLLKLQDDAKSTGKGMWSQNSQNTVRDVKWTIDDHQSFLKSNQGKVFDAVIENVRDGSTVRAFLLPDFYYVTVMISGIRCPPFPNDDGTNSSLVEEAKFFVESRLLQHDVKITIESASNQTLIGSVLHKKGNISELLLKNGLAKFIDWSTKYLTVNVNSLKSAEAYAKQNQLGVWKGYKPTESTIPDKDKTLSGIVTEICNGAESLIVKLEDGAQKKVFLSSIKLPKDMPQSRSNDDENNENVKGSRFLVFYNNSRLFDGREFLRKKLIRKKVQVIVDYIQPARDNFPEKVFGTVIVNKNEYVSEQMVGKGLATVVRHRQDDEQKSSRYTDLLAAEKKAEKHHLGVFSNKIPEPNRIVDISNIQVAKQHLSALIRAGKINVLVDFVASGSKVRVYWPKEKKLFNFLLAGIKCPRTAMRNLNNNANANGTGEQQTSGAGEPFAEEALQFVRDKCLQREVTIRIESTDKAGNFIGWLWVDDVNLSIALVEEGFAENFSDYSEYSKQIQCAEEMAKKQKKRRWANYVEDASVASAAASASSTARADRKNDENQAPRKREIKYEEVVVIGLTAEAHIYVQKVAERVDLENLFRDIQTEMQRQSVPMQKSDIRKNALCAARFSDDGNWYRAKIEKLLPGGRALVFYIDYGNREELDVSSLSPLPDWILKSKPFAHDYKLACVTFPTSEDYINECMLVLDEALISKTFLLNAEYRDASSVACTLADKDTKEDVVEKLIEQGALIVQNPRKNAVYELFNKYQKAEELARKKHLLIWEYGDIRDDDAKEFGAGR